MAGHTNNKNAKKKKNNKNNNKGKPFGGKKAAPFKKGNKAGKR